MTRPPDAPRPWHLPASGRHTGPSRRVLLGRQGIFTPQRDLFAYELLFRAPGRVGLRVDLWNARQQDRATEHVVAAAFHTEGQPPLDRLAFVNFTRSYLIERDWIGFDPNQAVIEVVESAFADDALRHRVRSLREDGYRIAIDDFVATTSQLALLEHADFVKIDVRDLAARGPELAAAGSDRGCTMIAERVEDASTMAWCLDLGFELFQGHGFEPAIIMDRGYDSRDELHPAAS
ncbi:EAL and HDOD domain-containing protein [Demequina sp. SO4-13]|uniref:EAL and HDOD domain-containing protein n=1 Tax=Demequina sp. SO4-13 TaxID=3401027 RepID=UPI003AF4A43E